MKHTQGPWKADGYNIRQASTGTRHVAAIAYTGPHHTPPEEYPKSCRLQDEANARLIAAAPAMLDALMQWQNAERDYDRFEMANACISRDLTIEQATIETP